MKFVIVGLDLFEVVDRRAKLVVSELSDEQQDGQAPGMNIEYQCIF